MNIDSRRLLDAAGEVLETEARAIRTLAERLGDDFVAACRLILDSPGHVVVTGMGKSGHIANKLAATLASTGTPAFFVHPAEASHGDLGMIAEHNTVLALSNSGETEEILRLLPGLKRLGVGLVAMTGNPASTLARHADVHLDTSVDREACPLGLAPRRRLRHSWLSATPWPSRCWTRADSPQRISRVRTRPAASAAACCFVSAT